MRVAWIKAFETFFEAFLVTPFQSSKFKFSEPKSLNQSSADQVKRAGAAYAGEVEAAEPMNRRTIAAPTKKRAAFK